MRYVTVGLGIVLFMSLLVATACAARVSNKSSQTLDIALEAPRLRLKRARPSKIEKKPVLETIEEEPDLENQYNTDCDNEVQVTVNDVQIKANIDCA